MIQRRDCAGLVLEAVGELLLRDFDRDGAMQPRVKGFVNLSHATGAHGREDLVRT